MSKVSTTQIFKVVKTDAAARTGCLRLPGHKPLETPAVLVQTQKGSALYLTHDLTEALPPGAALALNALDFFNAPPASVVNNHGGGAQGFLGHSTLAMIATARDAVRYDYPGLSNRDSGTIVRSSCGNIEVSPAAYHNVLAALRPSICVSLADDVPFSAGNNRVSASVRRTAQWLQAFLTARQLKSESVSQPTGTQHQHTSSSDTHRAVGDSTAVHEATDRSSSQDHVQCVSSASDLQSEDLASIPILAAVVGGKVLQQWKRSAHTAAAAPGVAGFSLTGFGTGETPDQMIESLQMAIGELPPPLLRLAQGISYPSAVVAAVGAGIDLFDAGLASSASSAALALAFDIRLPATMPEGIPNVARSSPVVDLKDTRHCLDASPLVAGCGCMTCKLHSRAYIHHLVNTKEMLALTLLEVHNLFHTISFFEEIRRAIGLTKFKEYADWIQISTKDMGVQGDALPQAADVGLLADIPSASAPRAQNRSAQTTTLQAV